MLAEDVNKSVCTLLLIRFFPLPVEIPLNLHKNYVCSQTRDDFFNFFVLSCLCAELCYEIQKIQTRQKYSKSVIINPKMDINEAAMLGSQIWYLINQERGTEFTYESFKKWCAKKSVESVSENVMLTYMFERSNMDQTS